MGAASLVEAEAVVPPPAPSPERLMNRRLSLYAGDCLDVLRGLPDESVHAVVCDPPYGLSREPDVAEVLRHWLAGDDYVHRGSGFMGKAWDSFVPGPAVWREALRVLKPGGHLVAFFGTRTYDLGTIAIRIAGFEIRDQLAWCYGSGFAKGIDMAKAIDATVMHGGARTEDIRRLSMGEAYEPSGLGRINYDDGGGSRMNGKTGPYEPATDAAREWQGWKSAIKPAFEPIVLARKPLSEDTIAANVLKHGCGALNIDACRVVAPDGITSGGNKTSSPLHMDRDGGINRIAQRAEGHTLGRFPANITHDGSDEVLAAFPYTKSGRNPARRGPDQERQVYAEYAGQENLEASRTDAGSAARFFYQAKASKHDRVKRVLADGTKHAHPTVKPVDLMRWLVRLVTPPNGIVLDPFAGTGTTGVAAHLEGMRCVLVEREAEYREDVRIRLAALEAPPATIADADPALA